MTPKEVEQEARLLFALCRGIARDFPAGLTPVEIAARIGEIGVRKGLLKEKGDPVHGLMFSLTDKGRRFAVDIIAIISAKVN